MNIIYFIAILYSSSALCSYKNEFDTIYSRPVPITNGEPWPRPAHLVRHDDYILLNSAFIDFTSNIQCEIITKSLQRMIDRLPRSLSRTKNSQDDLPFKINLAINSQICETIPYQNMSEEYNLTVDKTGATITTPSVWGALRAFVTLPQLIHTPAITKQSDNPHENSQNNNNIDNNVMNGKTYIINHTTIIDFPRFTHRGILIDTSRHFLGLPIILANLDAMEMNKFNVLHWHIVDDQSFPFFSRVFPTLSEKGAYNSDSVYDEKSVDEILTYAHERGIRVMMEFDTPGHTLSWGRAFPQILTTCYKNVTKPQNKKILNNGVPYKAKPTTSIHVIPQDQFMPLEDNHIARLNNMPMGVQSLLSNIPHNHNSFLADPDPNILRVRDVGYNENVRNNGMLQNVQNYLTLTGSSIINRTRRFISSLSIPFESYSENKKIELFSTNQTILSDNPKTERQKIALTADLLKKDLSGIDVNKFGGLNKKVPSISSHEDILKNFEEKNNLKGRLKKSSAIADVNNDATRGAKLILHKDILLKQTSFLKENVGSEKESRNKQQENQETNLDDYDVQRYKTFQTMTVENGDSTTNPLLSSPNYDINTNINVNNKNINNVNNNININNNNVIKHDSPKPHGVFIDAYGNSYPLVASDKVDHTTTSSNPATEAIVYEIVEECDVKGPLNPALPYTYDFLGTFFEDIFKKFPEALVHIGGDEVFFSCWQSNPQIKHFMQVQGLNLSNYASLENYFITRLIDLLVGIDKSRKVVVWQELFDNGVQINPDTTIVQVWKGPVWSNYLRSVLKARIYAILSSPWYLNYIKYGADWKSYYLVDPFDMENITETDKHYLLGGEACMWGEYIDDANLLPTLWPRASVVAERLWSPYWINNVTEAEPRLLEHTCRMKRWGIPAAPTLGPSSCPVY